MASPLSRQSWIVAVDRRLKRDWRISISDAGLSDEDLTRHWRDGDTPEAFVAWFAKKYDLIQFEPTPFSARSA